MMKNVLVTGGCGFVGSNFVKMLRKEEDVFPVILDKLTYAGNISNLNQIDENKYAFFEGDICDEAIVTSLFKKYNFDAVFHFAAETHVDRSIDGPGEFIKSNIIGTYNLLKVSRNYMDEVNQNFKFIHVSTDEVFGDLDKGGYFKETTPYNPSSPYSASKASSDHLVRAWGRTFGLPVIITNCSNNYGSFQFPEKLIPLCIINAINDKPLPLYGDGKQIRDWLYVDDHCDAIRLALKRGKIGETYNIGGNIEKTNIQVVQLICKFLDNLKPRPDNISYTQQISFVKDRLGHDRRYAIDSSKIQEELGWQPKETFESGMEKTIKWYLDHDEWVRNIISGDYKKWVDQHYS
jgi:dTDP-glucose 4,6-dehydratase